MKVKKINNMTDFTSRQYYKEIGFNNIYCVEGGETYYCSKDGEPEGLIEENLEVVK